MKRQELINTLGTGDPVAVGFSQGNRSRDSHGENPKRDDKVAYVAINSQNTFVRASSTSFY